MDMVSYSRHFWASFEVLRIVGRVIANVLGRPAAQERMLHTWSICGMEVNKLLMHTLLFKEVEREARIVMSVHCQVAIELDMIVTYVRCGVVLTVVINTLK